MVGADGRDAIWWGGWVVSCWCAALGFECLVACCGFPLSSGSCWGAASVCGWFSWGWWRVGSDACWSGWLSCVSVSWGGFLWRWLSGFACPVGGLLVGRLLGVVAGCSLLASGGVCEGGCHSGCVKARRCATQGAGIGVRTLGGFVCLCFSSLACPSGACWGFLGLLGA